MTETSGRSIGRFLQRDSFAVLGLLVLRNGGPNTLLYVDVPKISGGGQYEVNWTVIVKVLTFPTPSFYIISWGSLQKKRIYNILFHQDFPMWFDDQITKSPNF